LFKNLDLNFIKKKKDIIEESEEKLSFKENDLEERFLKK